MTGLYAIADRGMLAQWGVPLGEFAEGLRQAGVSLVQWRCKGGTGREVLDGATVLREVFRGSGCRLILNDRVELVEASGFDGVHVGQGDLAVEEARRVVGPARIVGVSTHTAEQVRLAEMSSANYVAIGPVFGTSTKVDAEEVVGLEGVQSARRLTGKTLVAIGGIAIGNAREVIGAGADMVAVIGSLGGPRSPRRPGRPAAG